MIRGALFHAPTWEAGNFVIFCIQGYYCQGTKVLAIDHGGFNDVLAEPNHATTTDSRECGITKVLDLEHDADIGWKVKAFAIR